MTKTYTITLSDAEDKALSVVAFSQQNWIDNAIHERCRIAIEEIVHAEVQRKLAAGEQITGSKEDIVLAAQIEIAAKRSVKLPIASGITTPSETNTGTLIVTGVTTLDELKALSA